MCFRVAIIRITDHFVFQGVEGAEVAADPPGPLGRSPVSGIWWVLVGSGRVLAGSGCVLELKNNTSKIIKIHCKKQCFGLRRLQDGAKMDPNNALFWSVKILRIHCNKQGLGSMSVIQKQKKM